jgi:hypothetical protein
MVPGDGGGAIDIVARLMHELWAAVMLDDG